MISSSFMCMGAKGMACSGAWFVIVAFFLGSAVLRKQLDEYFSVDFNFPIAACVSIFAFIVVFVISHNHKVGFIVGLLALLAGGFFGGMIWGDAE